MPRTRNVTRAQWDAVNASNPTTTGDQNQNHDYESEKENKGKVTRRATRSQTRIRSNDNRVVLGSTTTPGLRISTTSKGLENTRSANVSKMKGKGKAKVPPPKRKKLPLQDITSQFLPAPESANRGEEDETAEPRILQQNEIGVHLASPLQVAQDLGSTLRHSVISMDHPAPKYLDSPLPPSSPPSAITSSPQYPNILPKSNTSWLGLSYREENDLWNELDEGHPASRGSPSMISSGSDPFGFVALERKLKVERKATTSSPLKRHHQIEQDESDEILVADTSSPRQVRRLKHPLHQGDSTLPPAIIEHAHYTTPPTPHKDKKRLRLSHEEDGNLRSCSSSLRSTPSPSKPYLQKYTQGAGREDALDSLKKDEVQGVFMKTRNRIGRGITKGEPPATANVTKTPLELQASLDDEADTEEEQPDPKRAKASKPKKVAKKPRSKGPKKENTTDKHDNDADYAEKWERERQERAAYFKRLEGYQFEKEDVYVI